MTHKGVMLLCVVLLTSCGSQQWRLGNPTNDLSVQKKREKARDERMYRALEIEKNTAKHYIKKYKSHDGKINLFRRDGFDKIF